MKLKAHFYLVERPRGHRGYDLLIRVEDHEAENAIRRALMRRDDNNLPVEVVWE